MAGGVVMLGSMLILGTITTTDVAADLTNPKMDPAISALQALLTTIRTRGNRFDLIAMRTSGVPSVRTSRSDPKHVPQLFLHGEILLAWMITGIQKRRP